MTTPRVPTPCTSSSKRSEATAVKRRDDSGLTTLEWLLIVAAVAGLAALAVVLVQNVVSDTSEQIAGSSARKTAAQVAAARQWRRKRRSRRSLSSTSYADATLSIPHAVCGRVGRLETTTSLRSVTNQDHSTAMPITGNRDARTFVRPEHDSDYNLWHVTSGRYS